MDLNHELSNLCRIIIDSLLFSLFLFAFLISWGTLGTLWLPFLSGPVAPTGG